MIVTYDLLKGLLVSSGASKKKASLYAPYLMDALAAGNIDTPARASHFLAQIAHESDTFKTFEEYASGKAYEGRKDLGNIHKGDGVRFKGRGAIQTTGRNNYTEYNNYLKNLGYEVDVLKDPTVLAQPEHAFMSSVFYWNAGDKPFGRYSINIDADEGDTEDVIVRVTRRVNGGLNGLRDRRNKFVKVMRHFRKQDAFKNIHQKLIYIKPTEEVKVAKAPPAVSVEPLEAPTRLEPLETDFKSSENKPDSKKDTSRNNFSFLTTLLRFIKRLL